MARDERTATRVNKNDWKERADLYRAAVVKRGGGERGSMVRGSSICFSVPTNGIESVGADADARCGKRKVTAARRGRSS